MSAEREMPISGPENEGLIQKYIRPGEKHPLSEATIGRSGPSVWRIIRFFQASGDPDQVIEYFGFSEPTAILEAALAYYDRFKPFIDAKILLEADIPEQRPSSMSPDISGHGHPRGGISLAPREN